MDLVSAYVANNPLSAQDLPNLIVSVHQTLLGLNGAGTKAAEPPAPEPKVPIYKSITPDYLICLEDGKHYKSLRRHLKAHYNMTPDEYRAKWGLASDYPMVAPSYSKRRSELAKELQFGHNAGKLRARLAAAERRAKANAKPAPVKRTAKAASGF